MALSKDLNQISSNVALQKFTPVGADGTGDRGGFKIETEYNMSDY